MPLKSFQQESDNVFQTCLLERSLWSYVGQSGVKQDVMRLVRRHLQQQRQRCELTWGFMAVG